VTRRSSVSSRGLVARHLRSRASTSVALAVLVGLSVALAALIPRGLVLVSDAELQHDLAALAPGVSDLYGRGSFGVLDTTRADSAEQVFGPTDVALAGVPRSLPSPLSESVGPVSWVAVLPPDVANPPVRREPVQPVLSLAVDLEWQERVTLTEGDAPRPWDGDREVPLEIALSEDYAEQAGFEVGDIVDYFEAPLRVTAFYTAVDPDDPYWVHAHELLTGTVTRAPSSPTVVRGAAFIDPLSAVGLPTALQRAELRAWYPLLADTMTFDEVPVLTEQLRRTTTLGLYLPSGEALVFETGLPAVLDRVSNAVSTVSAVLALAGSAPLGALLAVLSLGSRAVLEGRRSTLRLARSRGASERQLRMTVLIEGLVIAVPATLLALACVTLLVPVPIPWPSAVLPALLALAVPALLLTSIRRDTDDRTDLGGRNPRWRWIVELVVVGMAALAVYLLVRRGLVTTPAGGVDPLLAATPLLLALVVCVLVLRIYPLPLLALQRAAQAGSSSVGLVGTTGSVRANSAAFGSVLSMVVGVSSAVLSLVLASTVAAGLGTAAVSETGSDIRVEAPTLDDPDRIEEVPGVRAVAGLDTVAGVQIVFGRDRPNVTVVFADTAALHAVRPDLPELAHGTILLSSDLAERSPSETALNGHPLTVVGTVGTGALPEAPREWVLVDVADKPAIIGESVDFDSLLIATEPGTDIARTAEAVREVVTDDQRDVDRDRVEVTGTATLVAAAASRPSIVGVTVALLGAAVLSVVLCALAVALGALAAAGERARMLGVLRLLGMTPWQLRGVLAWELAPVTITALLAGTGLGVGLAFGVTALVDLRSIVGGAAVIHATVPWALVAATAAIVAAVVGATGTIASAAARRLNAAAAVKMGAE